MEGLKSASLFASLVSESLADARFTLLDIGCRSGIDTVWRVFGERLRAFAFDPNVNEILRLREQESLAGVAYIPAYVGLPKDDVGAMQLRPPNYWARNPWQRLSVARTLETRAKQVRQGGSNRTDEAHSYLWTEVPTANPDEAIVIPQFLRERRIDDVDFVKIDVDGPDFLILRSLSDTLCDLNVLGVGIEVNFFGSDDPDVHTFHNVDRLMKKNGFELFSLSSLPYSVAAIPAPYQHAYPAESVWGRPLQGDAIYLRDAAAPEHEQWALAASPYKLSKLAALFSIIGLPDCAAEILLRFRARIAGQLDVDKGLELLTAQCIPAGEPVPSFAQYVTEFEADASRFYPSLHAKVEGNSAPHVEEAPIPSASNVSVAETTQSITEAASELEQRMRDDLRRLNEEIALLRSSSSWRLTAPLRAIADIFKQILRGAS